MDRALFTHILAENKDPVYGYALYMVGNREDAEDIAQDVFLSLWHAREEIEVGAVRWWLLRVCKNACLDLLRRRKVRLRARMSGEEVRERGRVGIETTEDARRERSLEVSDLGSGALRTELGLDTQRVIEAMNDLKDPLRSVIVLRETQDLTYEEIASTLDLSLSAVKVYLHRARRKIRERLQDEPTQEATRTTSGHRPSRVTPDSMTQETT
jgi:RNA polymerase sigma factor (sigma-70 family)